MQDPRHRRSILESLAANVRRVRVERGFTQADLAERAHVDVGEIQRIEVASIDCGVTRLVSIARALGVSVAVLVRPSQFVRAKRGRPRAVAAEGAARSEPSRLGTGRPRPRRK